ncbi:uncharacterized protein LOC126749092 [Anthonomus grandis grandis]|uniref:uncharacterized protein LOC126749092 n=1 Tax=Anthonomus grandis grandis TaxID=2921223 RepID=UPI0021657352|nr:uncharacterized protein LOC126749092 [Anthonomus grandis grandis]
MPALTLDNIKRIINEFLEAFKDIKKATNVTIIPRYMNITKIKNTPYEAVLNTKGPLTSIKHFGKVLLKDLDKATLQEAYRTGRRIKSQEMLFLLRPAVYRKLHHGGLALNIEAAEELEVDPLNQPLFHPRLHEGYPLYNGPVDIFRGTPTC